MRSHEIENWVLSIVERTEAGQPNEDSRVELKAEWPDPYKAARRIAGHANAAQGEPILWIIGVDEKNGVIGAVFSDLARWHAQVQSKFDGLAPSLQSLNIPARGQTVVALLFETERVPYVVKVEGTDRLEVPWRGSTSIRSAKREELLRLLAPQSLLPGVEILGGQVGLFLGEMPSIGNSWQWQLTLQLYVVPRTRDRVIIPYHLCKATIRFPGLDLEEESFEAIWMSKFDESSLTVGATNTELIIDGPGMFILSAQVTVPARQVNPIADARITLELVPAYSEKSILLETTIPYLKDVHPGRPKKWGWGTLEH